MAVSITTLAQGDTDYINSHNVNYNNIKVAIEALQASIGGGTDPGATLPVAYDAMFGDANAILGEGSYQPSQSAAHNLTMAAGFMYLSADDAVVTKPTTTVIDFTGQTTGTHYIVVDATGVPSRSDTSTGALYSVYYDSATGNFSVITRTGNLVWTQPDWEAAQSDLWSRTIDKLDDRLLASEKASLQVLSKTVVATNITLTDAEAFEQAVIQLNDGPQTANVDLIVPNQERVYQVLNDCSSTYQVTVKTAAGTGAVVNGQHWTLVYCDGTDSSIIFDLDRSVSGGAPASTFTDLSDTPNSNTGHGNKLVKVKNDESGLEYLAVHDTPVDAAATTPISSNWAYDHENAADPHPAYLTAAEGNAAYIQDALVDVKGDLIAATAADTVARLAAGTNGYVLTADSAEATGLKWAAVGAASDLTLLGSVSAQSDQATVAASLDTLYVVTTGVTNATCTVNLPTPTGAGQAIGIAYHAENAAGDKVVIHPATSDEINGSTADIEMLYTGEFLLLVSDGDGVNWYIAAWYKPPSPYLVSGFFPGAGTASAKLMVHVFATPVDFPSGLTGSQGTAETAATAQTDYDIQKNGVSVGTMRFAAAGSTSTFIMASATSFAAGDKLQLVAPGTLDSTLADIAMTLKGTRV